LQKTVKGIIFNLLEEVVVSHHGEDTWDQLLTATSLDGAYTSLGSYPDGHVQKLVAAASQLLGLPVRGSALVWTVRYSLTL
jgi:hypothetical protein